MMKSRILWFCRRLAAVAGRLAGRCPGCQHRSACHPPASHAAATPSCAGRPFQQGSRGLRHQRGLLVQNQPIHAPQKTALVDRQWRKPEMAEQRMHRLAALASGYYASSQQCCFRNPAMKAQSGFERNIAARTKGRGQGERMAWPRAPPAGQQVRPRRNRTSSPAWSAQWTCL